MKSSSSSAMTTPVRPIPPDLPVGYRFDPTDEELIGYYLVLLLNGLYSHDMPIGFVKFWDFEPGELPGRSRIKSDDQIWYFFCKRVVYMDKKKRMFKRKTPGGHWTPTGKPTIIENFGKRNTLRFYKHSSKVEKTEWIAYEYEIKQTSTLQNPGEFVIIKLMNSSGEKRTKMKTDMSKPNFNKMSASVYDHKQCLDEVMSISDCCSHEVPADFEYQNAGNMSAMSAYSIPQERNQMASANEVMIVASSASHDVVLSDFDTSEPSSRATFGCQNQSSKVKEFGCFPMRVLHDIPENHEENEQSNCLLVSDFENQKLPSEIEDSSPKTTACIEKQVTQDETNRSCSVTSKPEDHLRNEDIDLSFLEDDDCFSELIDLSSDLMRDFDAYNEANDTFPEVDPEVLADQDAFHELKCSLNPGEQQ